MTDKYPDEIFVTDIKGSNGRLWNMPVIGDDGKKSVQYVRGDLIGDSNAQSLADALLECVGLVRVYTSEDDSIAQHAINNAKAAIANYRKGE